MSAKHFVNGSPAELVADALESLIHLRPGIQFDKQHKIVYSTLHDPSKHVALVSGGGAAHEPAHAMYVGPGMLSAAVSGNIFASPSVSQIYNCIRNANGAAGTILIVKNYTGDIFHFHQAAQKLRAQLAIKVEVVVVGDDVSLQRSRAGKVGRRGLAGTVLMHKILGAASAAGRSLEACMELSDKVNAGLATIGASLDHVDIPGQKTDAQIHLAADELELGMGIHNEPGAELLKPKPELNDLLDKMLRYLLDADSERGYVEITASDDVVLMVNNLGALSVLELSIITTNITRRLGTQGIKPVRTYSGTFMTSLNGPGFSITLLKADWELLLYLDVPTSAVGWPVPYISPDERNATGRVIDTQSTATKGEKEVVCSSSAKIDGKLLRSVISSACQSAIAAEPFITKADTIVGDGDCGLTLKRGSEAVLKLIEDTSSSEDNVLELMIKIAFEIEGNMDGTSGAIYALFFSGLAATLRELDSSVVMGLEEWVTAALGGLVTVQKVTPARSGDRTLMDALEPFVYSLKDGIEQGLQAARKGSDSTKGLKPAFGRAVYVNEQGWEQVPDPGAASILAIIEGISRGLAHC
uniref:Dihydroxyacetone kinase n=1 Tax=Bionectria ochroleuca TaxID=29856 RepID=A0A8H7K2P1_BIOOC